MVREMDKARLDVAAQKDRWIKIIQSHDFFPQCRNRFSRANSTLVTEALGSNEKDLDLRIGASTF